MTDDRSDPDFTIEWYDSGREPQCQPNPDYPEGVDLDVSHGAAQTCTTPLPYPAKRCGHYIVQCNRCGFCGAVTTAGRPDDPRSVTYPCQPVRVDTMMA